MTCVAESGHNHRLKLTKAAMLVSQVHWSSRRSLARSLGGENRMNERLWWLTALKWTLWAIVMAVVMGWLGRNRFRPRHKEELGTLRHPTSTLMIGVVCFSFCAALTIYSAVTTDKTASWQTTTLFAGFAAMSALMTLEYFMARHCVSDEGLAYRKLLGSTGFLRWSELKRIRYGSTMKWFRLDAMDGRVVRLSAMLMGLPEFAQALLKSAPAEAMDSDTLQILQATAEGNPPSLWE
jgi:hypothetical protein